MHTRDCEYLGFRFDLIDQKPFVGDGIMQSSINRGNEYAVGDANALAHGQYWWWWWWCTAALHGHGPNE